MSSITSHGLTAADIHKTIKLLTNNLVNIKDTTGEFLLKLDDGRVIDTKGWNDWEWTHGVGLYGLWNYYTLTLDPETLRIITDWFTTQLSRGTTKNINTMSPFLTLAYLYEETHNKTYIPWLDTWAEWLMHDLPRTKYGGFQHETYNSFNKDELWDDTLMMSVLPLAKIGLVLDRPHYIEEAKRQFLLHCQYLFDPETGLFFHGWKFNSDEESKKTGKLGHNFARARWARGNAWLTIAIPTFLSLLSSLPPTHPSYLPTTSFLFTHLLSLLHAQCTALIRLQTPTGHFTTLLDIPASSGSYPETSATAGFAYGLLLSLRLHYITGPEYVDCAVKALKAVLGEIDADGEVQGVSFGTAMGSDLEHYLRIKVTSMPYGQSMAVMALEEFLRTFI
ncbi:Six-hairpin glycosidase-like protein [Clohesyomyces aquaticus]|uniref:Six-hairpin glycosidase-like protein n=1 Tax=Clohesyomyces aquaticus TaxID=1231657 RepID=A0A1Y1ZMK8_9PLEO|nr:Six-hairpin glycosidase-like protein [Clohesyomyces aquaticus]